MKPIATEHGDVGEDEFKETKRKAVLLTSHFKRHRRQLWRLTHKTMGGDAFGRKIRPTDLPKRELLVQYLYNLCPENRAAEGYITEKMPEAFLCGCVPITYCTPEDLALDFNPNAVINLYGLNRRETRNALLEAGKNYKKFTALRQEPLILKRPDLSQLFDFLKRAK